MFARKPTNHGYWLDSRSPNQHVNHTQDTVYPDDPISGGLDHLARGYALLTRWSGETWKYGDLLGAGPAKNDAKRNTATYAAFQDWDKIQDPRVATSVGHIIQRGRPRAAAPGWGGYDQFTPWQASGRCVRPSMLTRPEHVVVSVIAEIPFVDKEGREGPKVKNSILPSFLPKQKDAAVDLYAVMHRKNQN